MSNFGTFFLKNPSTKFVVKNIAPRNKRIKIFQYPINNGDTRDLLAIPSVSEADIRCSLLKGELAQKIKAKEVIIIDSDIDLLQFNNDQKLFLQEAGVIKGLTVATTFSGTGLTLEEHEKVRQLVHLADGDGPWEGFASGAFREILPDGNAFPTQVIWWESVAKLNKIVEKTITRNSSQEPIEIVWKVYDTNGSVLAMITDTITYSGSSPFESTRVRTIA